MGVVEARSWVTLDAAKKLLVDCRQDFEALRKSAITKEFRPVVLNANAYVEIKQQIRSFKSHNVIGKLDGSDPKLQDEYRGWETYHARRCPVPDSSSHFHLQRRSRCPWSSPVPSGLSQSRRVLTDPHSDVRTAAAVVGGRDITRDEAH